ncbi:DUF3320 domain-containing protein [Hymenobacter sp. HSC-4F20]|uniref:DUF3320 domain-containing protein n=1 Tax=Hymenobacter sp. HSC-4F20 TaxID=2864135 RepID=UPI001C72D3B7|nr:DUF3320 domain-containing protein [Hymenobacter sp. HSC-4F20]MBX0292516.1 DUF3320 domain-containing protein [Hymenobacter sp. HSC-4F20]
MAADFSGITLAARLHAARQQLLDLGLRNPLLNYRASRTRGMTMVGAEPAALLRQLLEKSIPLNVAPAAPDNLPPVLPATCLRAEVSRGELERRLRNTYYAARTSLEEQGVQILYLALGQLRWYDAAAPTEVRHAPLVLVPVTLERTGAQFTLRYTGGAVEGNLSLQAKLKASFGLALPLPLTEEPLALDEYLMAVASAVAGQSGWEVDASPVVLDLFSFAKLLLYRDLDPSAWPERHGVLDHPAVAALLTPDTGFAEPLPTADDTTFLDTHRPDSELQPVFEADASQRLALLAVREGRNLVVQGPPGTGKSQTIANLLAEAIGAGKKVLFVAEKMAALEVIKRRLDAAGLGAACWELHSHTTNARAVHEELKAALHLSPPASPPCPNQVAQLPLYRADLNAYALAVHTPIGRSRRTAQQVAGELLQVRAEVGSTALPRLPFPTLSTWTDAEAARAEAVAAQLQATLLKVGVPSRLAFWGSELTVLLPTEQAALVAQVRQAQGAVGELQNAAAALASYLGLPVPLERTAAEQLLPAARHAQLAPPLTGVAVLHPGWEYAGSALNEVLGAGMQYAALRRRYEAVLLPEAWSEDLRAERAAVLTAGVAWWRFLSPAYRRTRARLQQLWRQPLPPDPATILAPIDAVHEARHHARTIAHAQEQGSALFGPRWQGVHSDWAALRKSADYLALTYRRIAQRQLPAALLPHLHTCSLAGLPASESELDPLLAALEKALRVHRSAVQAVVATLQLNEARRFGSAGRLQFQEFTAQQATLSEWEAAPEALVPLLEWNNAAARVQAEGLGDLLLVAEQWEPAPRLLAAAVRQTWLELLLQQAYALHPALRQFEREAHEETVTRFRAADLAALSYHRGRAARKHYEHLPHPQAGGQVLLLRHELAKKTRHKPLRRLMQEAGAAIQAIKPIFMMSPLSVASFLPPGAVEFDIVVFDEASQVRPVDALGAIARGRQLVVVGDSRQLPPTTFFDSLLEQPDEAAEENATADVQSILELCQARGMPVQPLRWHYRSAHESLITLANQLFYDNKLVVFPNPGPPGEQLGLAYRFLPTTYYERGTTRTNPLEANAVAEAVLHHAATTPHLTLGVVAFSSAQRQAVQEALERRRPLSPVSELFFSQHPHEPFFIKSLENVQGDERDVVLISLGYGRTREGVVPMNFGPLNGVGGERRLNVLITRARRRCEIFTNLSAPDLDLSRSNSAGVAALKAFLHAAQHGPPPSVAGLFEEAPFEQVVAQALTARGYTVHPRVGSPGFHLELAVVDPEQPQRYVLGITTDGAMYRAARTAHDRDQLRQQLLATRGWRLHHIWSPDWLRNPEAEAERAVQAIEAARAGRNLAPAPLPATAVTGAVLTDTAGVGRPSALAEPYQVAQLPAALKHRPLHQHSLGQLATWLALVVRIESPVHVEEATRRLAQASGATQMGSRLRAAGQQAAALAAHLHYLRRQGDFLWENTMQQPPLRNRCHLPDLSRKLRFVAPEEISRALQTVIMQGFSLPREVAYLHAVRLLGFRRLTADMRPQLDARLASLLERNAVVEVGGVVKPAGLHSKLLPEE